MTVTRTRGHHPATPLLPVCCRGWIGEQALAEARRRITPPKLEVPRHEHDVELGWAETVAALVALEGGPVAVRVVEPGPPETVAAVLRGTLAPLRREREPTLFWPVRAAGLGTRHDLEEPGVALRHDKFGGTFARVGGAVLVIAQGPLVLNVRRG